MATARTYLRALRLVWTAAPGESGLMAAMLFAQGLVPPLSVWIVKSIVDLVSSRGSTEQGVLLVGLWAGAALVGQLVTQWIWLVQASLNERVTAHVELLLARKANSLPDLAAFEDSAFYDSLQLLTRQAPFRPTNLMVTTAILVPALVASFGLLALVGSLAWWLVPLLVAGVLPLSYASVRLEQQSWQVFAAQNPLARAMRYFASIATTIAHAKEVRLFGLGPYFEGRHESAFVELRRQTTRARLGQARAPVAAALLFVGVNVGAFWWVVSQALRGQLGLGDVVLLLQALAALQQQLGSIARMASVLVGHLFFFEKLFDFLGYRSPMRLASPGVHLAGPLRAGIVFDAVSYRYQSGTLALDGVGFAIRPGERVALVGENGAGKTTLVKLLCRLYDPTSGAIRVDGVDLRELDLEGWRASIGAVFQDFGHYQLTVAENIGLGRLQIGGDQDRIERAAHDSGFARHVAGLADGYAAQIGVEFGGVDLSGGQWQSLALARALVRDAEVLILDEPTAALDARAEYEVFARFSELSKGRTTVLVTHRLGSVRMADRILVLKHGKLVEQGTHQELMRLDGEYATLYRMQAEQYRVSGGNPVVCTD